MSINFEKIWKQYPQNFGFKAIPHYRRKCKAMKSWMILDTVCTLNHRENAQNRDNSSNFEVVSKNLFFCSIFFTIKINFFELEIACTYSKVFFDWNSLLFLLWFSNRLCIGIAFRNFFGEHRGSHLSLGSNTFIWLLYGVLQPQNYIKTTRSKIIKIDQSLFQKTWAHHL